MTCAFNRIVNRVLEGSENRVRVSVVLARDECRIKENYSIGESQVSLQPVDTIDSRIERDEDSCRNGRPSCEISRLLLAKEQIDVEETVYDSPKCRRPPQECKTAERSSRKSITTIRHRNVSCRTEASFYFRAMFQLVCTYQCLLP